MLGPPEDESAIGKLLGAPESNDTDKISNDTLEDGPFAHFIDTLFDD